MIKSMRIVTWNCQMGFDRKADALLSLNPDVAIVQECSEKSTVTFQQHGYETLWFGSNSNKGVGVFCRKGWSIRALPQPQQKWIVPVEVDAPTPFTLLAVWATGKGIRGADSYSGRLYQALTSHPEWFDGAPVVLAGDLNSNKIWDKHGESELIPMSSGSWMNVVCSVGITSFSERRKVRSLARQFIGTVMRIGRFISTTSSFRENGCLT